MGESWITTGIVWRAAVGIAANTASPRCCFNSTVDKEREVLRLEVLERGRLAFGEHFQELSVDVERQTEAVNASGIASTLVNKSESESRGEEE
jgi:hypothetical protein